MFKIFKRLSIKYKLIIGVIILNTGLTFSIGFVIYRLASDLYLEDFRNRKLRLVQMAARSIPGEIHSSWMVGKDWIKDERFLQFRKLLLEIWKREPNIQYIFSIEWDENQKQFRYIASGGLSEDEIVWIENWDFGFYITLNEKKEIVVHRGKELHEDFFIIQKDDKDLKFKIENTQDFSKLKLNKKDFLKYSKIEKIFFVENTALKEFGQPVLQKVESENYSGTIQVYYTPKNSPDVNPGTLFYNHPDFAEYLKKLLIEGKDEIKEDFHSLNYGKYLNAVALIPNENERFNGLIIMKVSEENASQFLRKILNGVIVISIITFLANFAFIGVFSGIIVSPLNILNEYVEELKKGNLSFRKKINTRDEFQNVMKSLNSLSTNLSRSRQETKELIRTLEEKVNERTRELQVSLQMIRYDLNLAKKIQQSILPKKIDKDDRIRFNTFYRPQTDVGGDIYDIYKVDSDNYRMFIADATGHGVQAALITMVIKVEYDNIKNYKLSPGRILEIINANFFSQFENVGSFFTCCIIDVDLLNKKIKFSSGGHPVQFLIKKEAVMSMEKQGPLIGLRKDARYKVLELDFEALNRIFLFTDGLFEIQKGEDLFGEDRIQEILFKYKNLTLENSMENVISEISDYAGSEGFPDDITFIGIEFT